MDSIIIMLKHSTVDHVDKILLHVLVLMHQQHVILDMLKYLVFVLHALEDLHSVHQQVLQLLVYQHIHYKMEHVLNVV